MRVWAVSLLTLDLSAQSLTPKVLLSGIRSLVGISTIRHDIPSSALPPERNLWG